MKFNNTAYHINDKRVERNCTPSRTLLRVKLDGKYYYGFSDTQENAIKQLRASIEASGITAEVEKKYLVYEKRDGGRSIGESFLASKGIAVYALIPAENAGEALKKLDGIWNGQEIHTSPDKEVGYFFDRKNDIYWVATERSQSDLFTEYYRYDLVNI